MFQDIIDIIITSAEGSFLQVSVFVGVVLLLFGYINYKKSGAFIAGIEKSKKWQPIIGALLGLTPGCGGAILVMPLFFKGSVSFGTVVATLVSTTGDAAFVLITAMPLQYIQISVISFVVAIITGYIVDYFGVGKKLLSNMKNLSESEREKILKKADDTIFNLECHNNHCHLGHKEGDDIDLALHHNTKGHQNPKTLGYKFTHKGFSFYWLIISVGLILGIMLLMQIDVNTLFIPNLGTIIGVLGTILSIIMMVMGKKFIQDDTHEEQEIKSMSLKQTLIHNAQETAFVATWVFVAYLIYEFGVYGLGGGDYAAGEALLTNFMTAAGLLSIIVGVAIGLIPGCGPQIIFVALFAKGMIPFAALLANSISQDGDALFPLLAIDRKSALWATIITTIPALIVGIIFYIIETNIINL